MMRLRYVGLWAGFGIIFYFIFRNYTGLIFQDEGNLLWESLRNVIISGFIAFVMTVVLYFFSNRKEFAPYVSKLFKFRSLLYQLVKRDFKAKYKRSFLGVLWTVLNPLFTMLVLTVVFSTIFRFDIENYPVYLLSGQVIFSFFNEATSMAMSSILASASMIKKVNMPKYIFPLSKVLSSLVNFAFTLVALILVMLLTHSPFYWNMLLMIIPIIYIFIFSLGVGLILSAAVVFFRDMIHLYGILLTALAYFTPLFYPISIIPEKFRLLISLNPLYHFVEYFRTVAIYGGIPTLWQNILCGSLAIVAIAVGLLVFYKKQDRFILYI